MSAQHLIQDHAQRVDVRLRLESASSELFQRHIFGGCADVFPGGVRTDQFFLNAVAWLAGLDVSGSPGMGGNVISARMDRSLRIRFVLLSVCGVPVAVGLLGLLARVWKRRRRK